MHTVTTIAKSLGEVTLIALILGAGLPVIFAAGIRLWSAEPAVAGEAATTRRGSIVQIAAYACFALVAIAVLLGIVYIAKDFVSHTFDIQLFGAKPPKK
ncbi:hypothetical protein NONO_c48080 [Nocardia nova SH22a]|uniref:Transmembrane protein n=1 Tax=Nocardia nova SH22a TaxID=1415166 RepID=W5TK38_9NOCA|nr:hypothetical protein [Nocardia nova]AHH19592.1 hypothetical protein NONO_c48080 [Nocardia nova SH22a]